MAEMNVPESNFQSMTEGPVKVNLMGFGDIDFTSKLYERKNQADYDLALEIQFGPDGTKYPSNIPFFIKMAFNDEKRLSTKNTADGNYHLFNMVNTLKRIGCEVHLDDSGYFTDAKGTRLSTAQFVENINLQMIKLDEANNYYGYAYLKPGKKYLQLVPMVARTEDEIKAFFESNKSFYMKPAPGGKAESNIEVSGADQSDLSF